MGGSVPFGMILIRRCFSFPKATALLLTLPFLFSAVEPYRLESQNSTATTGKPAAETAGSSNTSSSQESEQPESAVDQRSEAGVVTIDGREILSVYQAIGSFTANDRAEKITERILAAAKNGARPNSVGLTERANWTEISSDGQLLLAISDEDARFAGKDRVQLASEYAENIRQAFINYRRDHTWRAFIRGLIYSSVATAVFLSVLFIARKLYLYVRARVENWIEKRTNRKGQKTALQISATYAMSAFAALGFVARWLILIALLEIYVTVILSYFPQTRAVSQAVTGWIFGALGSFGNAVLAYLPSLFLIAVVVIVASQVSRLITMAFDEIGNGNLPIRGFYPEWAQPSARLMKLLVLVLVLIVIFPYLPGSNSPAFHGISIFVGILLSLGSSSAVANAIAGIILTYMRSFSVGDWVKIGETVGEVKEKNMLVTRILTPKQEVITIPNATVMSGSVMNYTREAKNAGVIFHTTVTIGYDAPWKTVHRLLIDAAFATEHVRHDPAPFVLQTQLNDFFVTYELNAYTDVPTEMQFIYSDLHQNIQDKFNEAGLEICSPHFAAVRDGNTIAIPAQYIRRDYIAPGFRVDRKEKEAELPSARIK